MRLSYPFLSYPFFDALEQSGCTTEATGWNPMHVKELPIETDFFMPLYNKTHSMGEYVFDYVWANAFHQYRLNYYPKLVTSIPFTPVQGPRISTKSPMNRQLCESLLDHVKKQCQISNASSWHMLFADRDTVGHFKDSDLMTRYGIQFHWKNKEYKSFDDFLCTLNARKRKMIKKERMSIHDQSIDVNTHFGADISQEVWNFFFKMYERTYFKRNGTRGYLNKTFFDLLSISMRDQLCMAVAKKDQRLIGCALYFFDQDKLYGRYWGSTDEYEFLHFELCCYQGIEIAIEKKMKIFDAGAQGEHKLLRGFEPVKTRSLHWIKNEDFRKAISDFLVREKKEIDIQMKACRQVLPFKKTTL